MSIKINHFFKTISFSVVFMIAFIQDIYGHTRVHYTIFDRLFDNYGTHSLDVLRNQTTDVFFNPNMSLVNIPSDIFWTNPKSNRFFSATTISRYNGNEHTKKNQCRVKLGDQSRKELDRLL